MLRRFEADLHKGDKLFAQIYMLMGGGPPRCAEMLDTQWTNGQSIMRNFYIIFGRIAMVTMYNKSEIMANAPRVVARFYPTRVGRLSLAMVAEVLPFLTYLQSASGEPVEATAKMWTRKAHPLKTTDVTKALEESTNTYLGVKLGVRALRHVLIGIDRELIRQPAHEARDDTVRGAYEAQTGHSETTEEHNYAIQLSDLSHMNNKTLRAYFGTSSRSHKLYEIDDVKEQGPTESYNAGCSGDIIDEALPKDVWMVIQTMAAQVQQLTLASHKPTTTMVGEGQTSADDSVMIRGTLAMAQLQEDELLKPLRLLYGDAAQFRPGQSEACRSMLADSDHDLFVQLPTGGGKTLLIEMAALHDRGKVNIVIVPYTALRLDMEIRLRRVGVMVSAFKGEMMGHVSVVLVTPEKANTKAFQNYWRDLQVKGLIGRLFWDECHLIEMEARKRSGECYRPYGEVLDFCARQALGETRIVQRVFLSATLPADIKQAVQQRAKVTNPNTVRTSTSRQRLRWEVCIVPKASMEAELRRRVQTVSPNKVIVFVLSLAVGEHLHAQFGWSFYHGGMKDEGRDIMAAFNAGTSRVMITTTAAGSGWDADASTVILYGGAFDAVTAVQQAGRAGRQPGLPAQCVVLLDQSNTARAATDMKGIAWNMFLTTRGCRRVAIESYIDDCWRPPCYGNEQKCDNCSGSADRVQQFTPQQQALPTEWAFHNTIKSSSSTSSGYRHTDWSSMSDMSTTKTGNSMSPPRKRKRDDDQGKVTPLPIHYDPELDKVTDTSFSSEGFEILSSPSLAIAVKKTSNSQIPAALQPIVQHQPSWDQLLAWDKHESKVSQRFRMITAVKTIGREKVYCIFCWFHQLGKWDIHYWDGCPNRKQMDPVISYHDLDMLKLNMKKQYRLLPVGSAIGKIHNNCWTPLGSLHPDGDFAMGKDCEHSGLLLGLVQTGLQDVHIGQQLQSKFAIHPRDPEQVQGRSLLRPSQHDRDSIALWDLFLLVYGYRTHVVCPS